MTSRIDVVEIVGCKRIGEPSNSVSNCWDIRRRHLNCPQGNHGYEQGFSKSALIRGRCKIDKEHSNYAEHKVSPLGGQKKRHKENQGQYTDYLVLGAIFEEQKRAARDNKTQGIVRTVVAVVSRQTRAVVSCINFHGEKGSLYGRIEVREDA